MYCKRAFKYAIKLYCHLIIHTKEKLNVIILSVLFLACLACFFFLLQVRASTPAGQTLCSSFHFLVGAFSFCRADHRYHECP